MQRREARLRREYLYRKSIEDQNRATSERKTKLKKALDGNKRLPTDLRKDALALQRSIQWDDPGADGNTTHVDDEYQWAGIEDPKILVTTSREPSSRLKMFVKEVRLIFPNSQRMNRGNADMSQLVEACKANNVTDFIIVHEHRGEPNGLIISHLPYGPTAYFTLMNTVMRHDIPNIGTMSEEYPHLIFDKFSTNLGKRVMDILRYLFPVPKAESRRVISFINEDDHILFRHHTHKKVDGKVEITEVGPRFEMKLYQITRGTVHPKEDKEVEWVYKPYMNTAKKQKLLAQNDDD